MTTQYFFFKLIRYGLSLKNAGFSTNVKSIIVFDKYKFHWKHVESFHSLSVHPTPSTLLPNWLWHDPHPSQGTSFHLQSMRLPPGQYPLSLVTMKAVPSTLYSLLYQMTFVDAWEEGLNKPPVGWTPRKSDLLWNFVETGYSPALKAATSDQPQGLDSSHPPDYSRGEPVLPKQKYGAKVLPSCTGDGRQSPISYQERGQCISSPLA